jgi:hypothetical protein
MPIKLAVDQDETLAPSQDACRLRALGVNSYW